MSAPPAMSDDVGGGFEGIAKVAAQIQERVFQLESEQAVLELIQAESEDQQTKLDRAQEDCSDIRRKFLATMGARHGLELELWNVEQKKAQCVLSTEKLHTKTRTISVKKQALQANWEKIHTDFIGDHQLQREIFRTSAEASIGQREDLMRKRRRQLQGVSEQSEATREDLTSVLEDTKQSEMDLEKLSELEQEEDEAISKLAEAVKEMIGKRKRLKVDLREHKKACEKANEEAVNWEKEYCELMGGSTGEGS